MFGFILADLRRHWIGVAAIALIIACATALGVVVTLQERALRLGTARAAAAFDLVIGAAGSETQLVLSSVFLQAAPLPLMPGSVLAGLEADPRVAWAAPLGFGDFVDGHPVIGTTEDLVTGLGGLSEGAVFALLGDAVLGAEVPLALGATFHPIHGQLASAGEVHTGTTYTAVGRLARTGTPWDGAVLVPIEAVWSVHGLGADADHDADHDEAGDDEAGHDEAGHDDGDHGAEAGAEAEDHDHAHGAVDADAPIRPERIVDPSAPGLPSIVVKPLTFADAYKLRGEYRTEGTVAVFPAEVLTRLYATLGDARLVLAVVAGGAQALVAAAILLVVVAHVLQRRGQIGALRAFGAPRGAIFAIVWGEIFLILGGGLVAGFAFGYLAARIASRALAATSGVAMPVVFEPGDAVQLLALLGLGAVAAFLPALFALRQSPAAALRG